MNKKELSMVVATQTDFNKKDVEVVVDAVFAQIAHALKTKRKYQLPDLVTLKLVSAMLVKVGTPKLEKKFRFRKSMLQPSNLKRL